MIENARPDPIDGIGRKAQSTFGVELAERTHDAEVALSDELVLQDRIAPILASNGNHQPQVRSHEGLRRSPVSGSPPRGRQGQFLFSSQGMRVSVPSPELAGGLGCKLLGHVST